MIIINLDLTNNKNRIESIAKLDYDLVNLALRVMRGVEATARRLRHKPADERAPLHWVE